jgi:hypothetical protein
MHVLQQLVPAGQDHMLLSHQTVKLALLPSLLLPSLLLPLLPSLLLPSAGDADWNFTLHQQQTSQQSPWEPPAAAA